MNAWLDERTLPGDSNARRQFALNLREGVSPEGAIADWGDFEGDYPDAAIEADHDADTTEYYRLRRSTNIRLIK